MDKIAIVLPFSLWDSHYIPDPVDFRTGVAVLFMRFRGSGGVTWWLKDVAVLFMRFFDLDDYEIIPP